MQSPGSMLPPMHIVDWVDFDVCWRRVGSGELLFCYRMAVLTSVGTALDVVPFDLPKLMAASTADQLLQNKWHFRHGLFIRHSAVLQRTFFCLGRSLLRGRRRWWWTGPELWIRRSWI